MSPPVIHNISPPSLYLVFGPHPRCRVAGILHLEHAADLVCPCRWHKQCISVKDGFFFDCTISEVFGRCLSMASKACPRNGIGCECHALSYIHTRTSRTQNTPAWVSSRLCSISRPPFFPRYFYLRPFSYSETRRWRAPAEPQEDERLADGL